MTVYLTFSQDVTRMFQPLAANKDGTVRRTNRKKYTVAIALGTGKKGEQILAAIPLVFVEVCGVCANRGSPCKTCTNGDHYRKLPTSALKPWHHAPTIQGYEHERHK